MQDVPRRDVIVLAAAVIATLLVSGSVAPTDANAAAKDPRITKVTRAGSSTALSSGSVVSGPIEVSVSASADLGLELIRLEAQTGSDPLWYCLEQWTANGALSMTRERVWNTENWTDPRADKCARGTCSSCTENSDHHHGAVTTNGAYRMRLVAREQGQFSDANDAHSQVFTVVLSNRPSPPSWLGDPRSTDRTPPVVVLRWSPSEHPDVTEYHFVREDPAGKERIFAVDARNPSAQGCSRAGSVAYTCGDSGFTQSGTYKYALRALRPGRSGTRCALTTDLCVTSAVGPVRTVRVSVPSTPSASPTASVPASPPPQVGGTPSLAQSPVAIPQQRADQDLIDLRRQGGRRSGRPVPAIVAAAILALLSAGLVLSRRRRAGRDAS